MRAKFFAAAAFTLLLAGCVDNPVAPNTLGVEEAVDAPLIEEGRAIVETNCARCHAIGVTGTSPYPGAQSFRNFGRRWSREQLRNALSIGIIAEHDKAEARVPPMKLTNREIEAFLAYLDSIGTPENPAPRGP